MSKIKVAVLCGGISPEREVSLFSGKSVAEAMGKSFETTLVRLDENSVPEFLRSGEYIVYPALHGDYGEDGALQRELDAMKIEYAGSGELASRLCMVKPAAKALMKAVGIPVAREMLFDAKEKPSAKSIMGALGGNVIIKPADKGSSVGLMRAGTLGEAEACLEKISEGLWLAEEFFKGRELSVGVIYSRAAGIVEIRAEGGVYDYSTKYTAGKSTYEYPAKLSDADTEKIKLSAEKAFAACGCRDFARVDFIINTDTEKFIALEINTLPGMTATSLLPKSASCIGLDFEALCAKLIEGAIRRKKNA